MALKKNKRKDSKRRGNEWEIEIKNFFQELASPWQVERALPKYVFIKGRPISISHDFFGAADHNCIHPLFPKTLYIQACNSEGHQADKRRQAAAPRWSPAQLVEVWMRTKIDRRVHARVFRLHRTAAGDAWTEHLVDMKAKVLPPEYHTEGFNG